MGGYRVDGPRIIGPGGAPFVPRGFNVGNTIDNNGGGWPDWSLNPVFAQGMVSWGATAVRLVTHVTSRYKWSTAGKALAAGVGPAERAVDALADKTTRFWLQHVPVVIMDAHDLVNPGWTSRTLDEMVGFWARYAARWAGEPRVWFNLANEPNMTPDQWAAFHDRACEAVRGACAPNLIICDALNYASDVGHDFNGRPIPYGYDKGMVPRLAARWGNVVLSMHAYGAYNRYVTPERVATYIGRARAAGVPLLFGETGYPVAGYAAGTGFPDRERAAAHSACEAGAEHGVGVLWWCTNFNDAYKLVDVPPGRPVPDPFASGAVLNEAGTMFKAYLQDTREAPGG